MPIRYVVHGAESLLYGVGTGAVGTKDLRALTGQMMADPEFKLSLNQMWDFRDSIPEDVSFDGLFSVVQFASGLVNLKHGGARGEVRCAVLVESEEQFGLARMYQSLSDSLQMETEIFRDRAEALRWLGMEDGWNPGAATAI